MDVFNQIAQAQNEGEIRRAIDNWFLFGDQSQDAEYVIPHIVEHLKKVKEYSYYLQNTGVEQHVLHHLNNSIAEVEKVMSHIHETLERRKQEAYNSSYDHGNLSDEELKQKVIDKLHGVIG